MSTKKSPKPRLASCLCVHDDSSFLAEAIAAVKSVGPVFCFVSRRAWNGSDGRWEPVVQIAEAAGAIVILGDWPDESLHRRTALAEMKSRGYRHILIPDGDEVLEVALVEALVKIARDDLADLVRCRMTTFWRDAEHIVQPREELAPIILLNAQTSQHVHIREYSGERLLTLGPEYGLMLHLSYAGSDARILRKIYTWGHRLEVGKQWYERIWLAWPDQPTMRNLHPTHPQAYGSIERVKAPDILAHLPLWRDEVVEKPNRWPTVSVVIPLHGGPEEIRLCLESLGKIKDLLYETIVVDDASPDDSAEIASSFDFVTLLTNESNQGFAATCNKGLASSSGEVILFLNSDTIVPRAGLIRLIETLNESIGVGAAGPMSNNVGYYQRLDPTYTSLENIDAFAEDLALSSGEDRDVEMLVGFALAIKRSVLDVIGNLDTRFGRGMFEDTDLCYRIARAGSRLRLASRAYVHHFGSRTLQRVVPDAPALLRQNEAIYRKKWQWDLDIGYASHLPGLNVTSGLVTFNESRHPDRVEHQLARMRKKANISLTMIVRNEEKALGDCLESAKRFFHQIIVVDTGSTDRTVEIAREHGAGVYEIVWPDSFAAARNETLKYATGDWIFWLDADDTLPFATGMAILEAALSGQADAFIVPVQFLDNGAVRGTSVDHVKLFRNIKGLQWTRRIHEQILMGLSSRGIIPARLDVAVHHTHYDASPEGQARKLVRDRHLLELELAEDPNDPFTLFNIGMTENHAGDHPKAIEFLTRALENATPQMTHTRKIYAILAMSLRDSGEREKALEILDAGLEPYPDDPELHFHAAVINRMLGLNQEAHNHLRCYGEDISEYFSSLDKGILTYKRWGLLGDLSAELGNHQEALKWYLVCLEREPWFANAAAGLVDASLNVGDFYHARTGLDALFAALGPCRDWAEREAKYAERVGGPDNALNVLNTLAAKMPGAAEVRLTLARELLNREMTGPAISHLEELERGGVGEAAYLMSVVFEQLAERPRSRFYAYRAAELNPDNPLAAERVASFLPAIDAAPPPAEPVQKATRLLVGPHAGKLGPPTKRDSIVIVTYQSAEWIEGCLNSVLPTLGAMDELIVIDNASTDDTIGRITRLGAPNVTVIANKQNRGYAPAANQGIRKTQGEFIVLLNPDTVVHPNWLKAMSANLGEGIGAVGPMSDAISGDQFVGHYVPTGAVAGISELGALASSRFKGQSVETKFLVGMCVMVPRQVLDSVGLLDDRMVLGTDDLDLSWRLRCSGFKLVVALDSFVHHDEHASFKKLPKAETAALVARSDAILLEKLKRYYGANVPTSQSLWGCDIFSEALARRIAA